MLTETNFYICFIHELQKTKFLASVLLSLGGFNGQLAAQNFSSSSFSSRSLQSVEKHNREQNVPCFCYKSFHFHAMYINAQRYAEERIRSLKSIHAPAYINFRFMLFSLSKHFSSSLAFTRLLEFVGIHSQILSSSFTLMLNFFSCLA